MYLAQKGQELDSVEFVGIAEDVKINPGDRFLKTHFVKIPIPLTAVGGLQKAAVKWEVVNSVVDSERATKSYAPGEILLWQDLKTPPASDVKKLLAADERVLWIPVDTRSFVPSLVTPGDQVSFIVPRFIKGAPAPAAASAPASAPGDNPANGNAPRPASAASETIGPFRILSLGNRMGSPQVLRAAGFTPSQENVMAVAVRTVNNELDELGQKVSEVLRLTNFQQVQVLLHPAPSGPDATKKK
jgi:hypothetical protein